MSSRASMRSRDSDEELGVFEVPSQRSVQTAPWILPVIIVLGITSLASIGAIIALFLQLNPLLLQAAQMQAAASFLLSQASNTAAAKNNGGSGGAADCGDSGNAPASPDGDEMEQPALNVRFANQVRTRRFLSSMPVTRGGVQLIPDAAGNLVPDLRSVRWARAGFLRLAPTSPPLTDSEAVTTLYYVDYARPNTKVELYLYQVHMDNGVIAQLDPSQPNNQLNEAIFGRTELKTGDTVSINGVPYVFTAQRYIA